MPKERPILFSGSMVRALLSDSKMQTRRIVKPQPIECEGMNCRRLQFLSRKGEVVVDMWVGDSMAAIMCPYGQPGDRLWVRETFRIGEDLGEGWESWMEQGDRCVLWDAEPIDHDYCVPVDYVVPRNAKEVHNSEGMPDHWRSFGPIPSIFMPRWASRINLEITGVRVERLQDISEADAIAEGAFFTDFGKNRYGRQCDGWRCDRVPTGPDDALGSARHAFGNLFESINGAGSWDANPWVWVVEFRRISDGQ